MTTKPQPTEALAPTDPTTDPAEVAGLGYGDALAELEVILRELEGDAVDVDHLGERVRRAAVLIRHCRARIDSARIEIEQVVAELEPDG